MSTPQPTATRIVEAILSIVADRGLEHATVREVAAVAGVSVGTVQHHFPTKNAMLEVAFADIVHQVRARLEALRFGDDVRRNVTVVLEEILPLDEPRRREGRIQLAFAIQAIHDPALAATQRAVLNELHDALSTALTAIKGIDPQKARLAAHATLALADGLALHALSAEDWLRPDDMNAAADLVLATITTLDDITAAR